jgi:hypothetical protein
MTKLIILSSFIILLTNSSFALTIEFVGPCDESPFYSKTVEMTRSQNLGELTIEVLNNSQITYLGNEYGINQILTSPIGRDSLEIISENETMSYGWCFEVDGQILEVYPNEVSVDGIKYIKWFYAYAHYFNGNWIAQCHPSHARQSPFICSK